jgi:prolyl-tRNA editing enzyme YbaK/EbsC (Cys-tRNA(Pro) deacylase)
MNNKKILAYLEKIGLPHEILNHKTVYTAYDKAQTLGSKVEQIIKALVVKADKQYHLVLLPAYKMLDLPKLAKSLKVNQVKIVAEKALLEIMKGNPDALHAFASLYKLPLVVDKDITKIKEAIFPGGSFETSLKMKVKDFLSKEQAILAAFSIKKKLPKLNKVKKIVKKKIVKVKKVVKKVTKKKK